MEIRLLYRRWEIQDTLGEVSKLRVRVEVSLQRIPEERNLYVHIDRITFDVEIHSARDPSTSIKVGDLGIFSSLEPVTISQDSTYVEFCIPINTVIVEKMLDIRNQGNTTALKVNATVAGITYYRVEGRCRIVDIWQSQMNVSQNLPEARIDLVLITNADLQQILRCIGYSKIMKIEFPLYYEFSSLGQQIKAAIDLLSHAAKCLEEGNNECTMIDVRKALTNHLLTRLEKKQRFLNQSLTTDLISKSPSDILEIYKDVIKRIEEGLRAVLKITNKFLHDDNTIRTPPLRKDSEYVYFTTAFIVRHILSRLQDI